MFDRLKFDKKNEEEKKRQLISLQKRLAEALKAHEQIREVPIFTAPSEQEIKELMKR